MAASPVATSANSRLIFHSGSTACSTSVKRYNEPCKHSSHTAEQVCRRSGAQTSDRHHSSPDSSVRSCSTVLDSTAFRSGISKYDCLHRFRKPASALVSCTTFAVAMPPPDLHKLRESVRVWRSSSTICRRSAMAFKGVPETLKDHPALKNFNPRVCLCYLSCQSTDLPAYTASSQKCSSMAAKQASKQV